MRYPANFFGAFAGGLAVSVVLAAPAASTPVEDPCASEPIAVRYICGFVPMAPELDGDVDLSTGVPSAPTDAAGPPR